ncbi:type II secretion system F family protein [Amphibacillus jilinensis]|uniref:type II secretion system F family protein n=1 Tax=Amphibacillus jilinensis TaxID=1216008 RepID=UPI00030CFD20|nr:type II secretion system F family protein [Amphibacillus jilinensis]
MNTVQIISAVILVLALLPLLLVGKSYQGFIEPYKESFQFVFLAPVGLSIIDKTRLMYRLSGRLVAIQQKVATLYQAGREVQAYTKMYLAELISSMLICLLGGSFLALVNGGDELMLTLGGVMALLLPAISIKRLDEKVTLRKQAIIFELPEFASKIALLVNAGETCQKALIRCTMMKQHDSNPLYQELKESVTKIQNGESFNQAMEAFSKRCGVQEVSAFTTTILLNYRRGGDQLSLSLRELAHTLWEKRKVISKTRGEQASSKLVFPMILIFAAILLVIAFPAISIF